MIKNAAHGVIHVLRFPLTLCSFSTLPYAIEESGHRAPLVPGPDKAPHSLSQSVMRSCHLSDQTRGMLYFFMFFSTRSISSTSYM